MSYLPDSILHNALSIPITAAMRQQAQHIAQKQPTAEKVEQSVRNLLAVQVVDFYLQMMGTETDLQASQAWNPVSQLGADLADLPLKGGQRIECRALRPGERMLHVPPEVWSYGPLVPGRDRLGYVFVDLTPHEGKILGFLPSIKTEFIGLAQLQPLEALLTRLHRTPITTLGNWLEKQFSESISQGWITVKEFVQQQQQQESFMVFRGEEPVMAFRAKSIRGLRPEDPEELQTRVQQLYAADGRAPSDPNAKTALMHLIQSITENEELRWQAADVLWSLDPDHREVGIRRLLDTGMQFAGKAVALMVGILPRPDGNHAVLLRLYPMGETRYLPEGLQLVGSDAEGRVFLTAQARQVDDYIQLKFAAHPGESFSVQVLLDGVGVTEFFSA